MAYVNQKARFATEGFRVKRSNPDGTVPTATRFVGFANTANLSAVLDDTLFTAVLKIKIDNGVEESKTVDLTAADRKSVV